MDSNKTDWSDISIDNNTAVWTMREEGDVNGTYIGTFKFKCFLTPLQQIAANREQRELLGSNPTLAGEHESFLAYALTQLKYRIVEAPPFWTTQGSTYNGDLADENIIGKVLDKAIASELKYKDSLKKKKADAIERAKKAAEAILERQKKEDADEGEGEEDSGQS